MRLSGLQGTGSPSRPPGPESSPSLDLGDGRRAWSGCCEKRPSRGWYNPRHREPSTRASWPDPGSGSGTLSPCQGASSFSSHDRRARYGPEGRGGEAGGAGSFSSHDRRAGYGPEGRGGEAGGAGSFSSHDRRAATARKAVGERPVVRAPSRRTTGERATARKAVGERPVVRAPSRRGTAEREGATGEREHGRGGRRQGNDPVTPKPGDGVGSGHPGR